MASTDKIWSVEITRSAERQIRKVDRRAQRRIIDFLRDRVQVSSNPLQWGKALRGVKGELWRYRVGDCRLICDIRDEKIRVLVLEVGHRKVVYREV